MVLKKKVAGTGPDTHLFGQSKLTSLINQAVCVEVAEELIVEGVGVILYFNRAFVSLFKI